MNPKLTLQNGSLFDAGVRQMAVAFVCGFLYIQGFGFTADTLLPVCMASCGLALGAILLGQKKYLAGMGTGVVLAQIGFAPTSFVLALILMTACLLQSFLGAWLLSRYKKFELNFEVTFSFLALCLVCLVTPVVSTLLLLAGDWLQLIKLDTPLLGRINQYWMGDSVATILMTSLVLVWRTAPDNWRNSGRTLEAVAHFAVYFLVGQIIFFDWFHGLFGAVNRGYWLFPLLVIVAVRIGRHGVILLAILTVVQALSGAAAGKGYFNHDFQQSYLINLWNYCLALTMVGMTFSIILKNRLNIESNLSKGKAQLIVSEANFRMLFENSPTAMLIIDSISGQILQVNENAVQLWGYDKEEYVQLNILDLTYSSDKTTSRQRMESLGRGEFENHSRFEKRYLRKNGSLFWAEVCVAVVTDEFGKPLYNIGSIIDITERKQIEQKLSHLSMTVEQSPESIVITDIHANIEYVNESYLRKSGYSKEELIGQNSRMLQSGSTPKSTFAAMWQTLTRGESWEGQFINRNKEGYEYTEHAIISPIRQADGSITHYVAVKEDITEKLRSKMQLHRLAYYDDVTDLPNFLMMQEHIDQSLAQTRKAQSYGALIVLNIDRFKTVHDANGQMVSNLLLKSFGERLVQTLYASDVVARISGDEFCILLPDLDNSLPQAALLAMQISRKIHHCMSKSFQVGLTDVVLTACHGITVFTGVDDDNPNEIVRRASTAMHHAKSHGYEQSVFFESTLDQVVHKRFALEGELRVAISGNELRIYLQSQVDSRGIVKGAEALIRWQHPRQGLLSPAHFIGVAEESNLIVDIDNWVLNQVCQRLASLTELPIRISVNVSVRHFNQIDFVAQVRRILAQTGADPERLTLEITEGVVIDNLEDVIVKMQELGELGIHFSMDDFGTGYSSLSYLKRLPINELKIDKSFIQEVTSDSNDAAMVEGILAFTKHLNLRVVAEGVETLEQAAFLNSRAQILHQGYLYSVPEPIESWLANYASPAPAYVYK